jgi:hypothetical protein
MPVVSPDSLKRVDDFSAGRQILIFDNAMYKLQKKDLAKASTVLGKAFHRYPIFEYIIPDSSYRKKHLKHLCSFLLRCGISKGEVIAPSKSIEGVSIWLPPMGT